MTLRISIVLVCFTGLFAVPASAAVAPVGASPTNQDDRCQHPQACSDPIVVGSSDETPLPVELVGYLFHSSLCVGLDVDARQQGAICDVQRPTTDAIENVGQSRGTNREGPNFTFTYGSLRGDVASLDVTYRRNHAQHRALPVIAFVRDRLQRRLEQTDPFTGFVVLARGCVPIRQFQFVARDASGEVLQHLHVPGPAQPERRVGCNLGQVAPPPPAAPAPVGGPPTLDHRRCVRVLRPCGDPIVIGSEQAEFGSIEVVAYTTRVGLCVDVDMASGSAGGCPSKPPRSLIAITGASGGFGSNGPVVTQLEGTTDPGVTAVTARYRRNHRWHSADGLLARIEGDIQTRLAQPNPFGVFVVTVPGCVQPGSVRVAARAADGTVLERTREPELNGGPDICDGGTIIPFQGRH